MSRADSTVDAGDLVRAVTQAVVARVGDASPAVVDAVVAEVLGAMGPERGGPGGGSTPRGASLLPITPGDKPVVDYCMACVAQERARQRSRAVLTTTGRNSRGIVARITSAIAEAGGDILDISQTLVGDYFTMILVVDVGSLSVSFERFQADIRRTVEELGCQAMVMREEVMASLHRV